MLAGMRTRRAAVLATLLLLAACGESPLQTLGNRSSGWISEVKVVTTTLPPVDAPRFTSATSLQWSNDGIAPGDLGDPVAVVAAVFDRREGDRFIQASRREIAAVLPSLSFPTKAPYGAEWVSSQLVVESTGALSAEPSVAFGIWNAEPYTRSRSVAQMVVIRVANDPETAAEVTDPGADISCGRFAERTTDECALVTVGNRELWRLTSPAGNTFIWFEGPYRYELFGRPFVPADVLESMAAETVALSELDRS
jgi:hypothetical protein